MRGQHVTFLPSRHDDVRADVVWFANYLEEELVDVRTLVTQMPEWHGPGEQEFSVLENLNTPPWQRTITKTMGQLLETYDHDTCKVVRVAVATHARCGTKSILSRCRPRAVARGLVVRGAQPLPVCR